MGWASVQGWCCEAGEKRKARAEKLDGVGGMMGAPSGDAACSLAVDSATSRSTDSRR